MEFRTVLEAKKSKIKETEGLSVEGCSLLFRWYLTNTYRTQRSESPQAAKSKQIEGCVKPLPQGC